MITISPLDPIPHERVYELLTQLSPNVGYDTYRAQLTDMQKQGYFMIAAYEGDVIVGLSGIWIGTKFYCGKYLELDNFVVDTAHRGKGIGNKIIDYAIALANEKECTSLTLNATVENSNAHKLYDTRDFVRFGHHRLLWL